MDSIGLHDVDSVRLRVVRDTTDVGIHHVLIIEIAMISIEYAEQDLGIVRDTDEHVAERLHVDHLRLLEKGIVAKRLTQAHLSELQKVHDRPNSSACSGVKSRRPPPAVGPATRAADWSDMKSIARFGLVVNISDPSSAAA